MRVIALVFSLALFGPVAAAGQSVQVQGSGGPTLTDPGYSMAAGIGFAPTSRLSFLVELERTHLASQERFDGRVFSRTRGGTLDLVTGQVQVLIFERDRIGPYGLAGFAAGRSRPNVNDAFPDPVTNDARAIFFGGGLHLPLHDRVSLFADARFMLGVEGPEGIVAIVPVRGGLAWRF